MERSKDSILTRQARQSKNEAGGSDCVSQALSSKLHLVLVFTLNFGTQYWALRCPGTNLGKEQ